MNKLCKKIIHELQKRSKQSGRDYSCSLPNAFINICDTSLAEFASDIGSPVSDVRSAVKYLVDDGYLEYITMHPRSGSSSSPIGVRLSHKGKNSKEFDREELKRYIADKWIDFLALVIAIIAFIQSCIALSN